MWLSSLLACCCATSVRGIYHERGSWQLAVGMMYWCPRARESCLPLSPAFALFSGSVAGPCIKSKPCSQTAGRSGHKW